MQRRRRTSRPLAAILVPTLGLALVAYFAVHMVQGNKGLIARDQLLTEIAHAEEILDVLQAERGVLEARADGLGPRRLDLDLLDERARVMLNLVHEDEVVLFVDGPLRHDRAVIASHN